MLSTTQYALCEATKFIDCMIKLNNKISQAYQVRVRSPALLSQSKPKSIVCVRARFHACKYARTPTLYVIITDALVVSIAVVADAAATATSTDAIAVVLVLIVKQKVSSNIDKHDRKVIDKRAC